MSPCSGNISQTCGGFDRLSIYLDPTFPIVDETTISDYSPQGCYTDALVARAIAYRQDQLDASTLTTESCLHACKAGNYPFAGTEYGGE